MVKPSDSNTDSRSGQASPSAKDAMNSAQQELKRGVTALKAKDYDTALRIFQQLEQSAPTFQTKARMGMVQAYQQSGNIDLAREKCQELLTSPSTKVCQWAQQALAKLPPPDEESKRTPSSIQNSLATEDKSGFVPHDKSGFVPLEPSSRESGETSLPSSIASSADTPVSSSDREAGFTPVVESLSATETGTKPDLPAESEPYQSLFHYQQLNQQTGSTPMAGQPVVESTGDPSAQATASSPGDFVQQPVQQKSQHRQERPSGAASTGGLKVDKPYRLWLVQGVTAIATLWLIHWGLFQILRLVNDTIRLVRWPIRMSGFYALDRPHLGLIVILGVVITLTSPWLFDQLLSVFYQQKKLPTRQVQHYCPSALRLLRRVCRQRGWQIPELRLIPDSSPLCFSYGWSPNTARIVISQGLLEALTDEELTALYAYELAHIVNRDIPVLSGLSILLLLVYQGYWALAQWGDQKHQKWMQILVGIVANGLYGLFWLLRKLGLWLSRVRGEYCDRTAITLFQRPDYHQRLLLLLTERMPENLVQKGYLHPLLVSLDLLMPLSPNQAVSPGSFLNQVGLPKLIAEDCLNPYRYWLMANNSHAILGERLLFLEQWANYWNRPSLGLTLERLAIDNAPNLPSRLTPQGLLLQNAPLIGLVVGGGTALCLWFLGGIVNRLNWQSLSWLYQDDSILQGGLLIGLGLGILMRVNRLFNESEPSESDQDDCSTVLFNRPPTLPASGQPVSLSGTLVGTDGIANGLCQHLYLQVDSALVKLKGNSPLDWPRGLGIQHHPAGWINRQATVAGWQRRAGGLLWVDLKFIQVAGQPRYQCHGPQWTTGAGLVLCLWGIWSIVTGG
jgi:Zn-dependent protease with chaperone function